MPRSIRQALEPVVHPAKRARKAAKATARKESKHDRFARVIVPRMRRALSAIRLIGNCSSSVYEYYVDDVEYIFGTLAAAVEKEKGRYLRVTKRQQDTFQLPTAPAA